jgi:hypothetical protein
MHGYNTEKLVREDTTSDPSTHKDCTALMASTTGLRPCKFYIKVDPDEEEGDTHPDRQLVGPALQPGAMTSALVSTVREASAPPIALLDEPSQAWEIFS